MDIAILVGLIVLNGIFAMSEMALVSARRGRLAQMAREGDRSAAVARRLAEEPTEFLSTVQIGITAIGILNGIIGEAALAGPLAGLLHGLGLDPASSAAGATAIVVATITYLTIVVGELVPKRIAQLNAEEIAARMAPPFALLARLSRPFVSLLSASTDGILWLLRLGNSGRGNLTQEDIHAVLVEGSEAGIIARREHRMVRNVFRLDERLTASLMTPRSEIVSLDLDQPLDEGIERLIASDHSRFPVCRGGMKDVLGIITARQLHRWRMNEQGADAITGYLAPAVYVPELLSGMRLLDQFRQSGVQMVLVVDEYGEIQGLITQQDFLQALAGEFRPEDPEDLWSVRRADGSWLLDGRIPIPELKDRLELREAPEEEKGRYHTLSGMLMWRFERIPGTGDALDWQGWRFEVVDLDGNRIDKVLASRLPEPPGPEEADGEPQDAGPAS